MFNIYRGHAGCTGEKIIVLNDDGELSLLSFDADVHRPKDTIQIVGIPWVNSDGENVQLSIGVTRWSNVTLYARNIWFQILNSLKKKQLKVVGCGSGVNVAHYYDIVMKPTDAFSFGSLCYGNTVANTVKGFYREVLDSIRHAAPNDIFEYLNPVEAFLIRRLYFAIASGSYCHNTTSMHSSKPLTVNQRP